MTEPGDGGLFHLRPEPTHCSLCFQPLVPRQGELFGGLTLCPGCRHQPLAPRLAFRGFTFQ